LDKVDLIIQNGNSIQIPALEEPIGWETTRAGAPGKLTFTVVKDPTLNFQEGNPVSFKKDGKNVFYGFIFSKKRNKGPTIEVTAYDQLRYFKNKDTYIIENETASDFHKRLIADFQLSPGTIEDTKFVIPSRVEDNKTLFDMSQNTLDITLANAKEMFVLYDDFGKLTLKNIGSMKVDFLVDDETGEDFDYTSSIDSQTYNKIKLAYDNTETGKREIYIVNDPDNIDKWGVLQYFEKIEEQTNGQVKADALLSLYNRKTRSLKLKNIIGDVRVRGGSLIVVNLNLGDITVKNYMMVENAKHNFKHGEHFMDLTVRGGDFIA
jgi:hypothetical protein